MKWLDLDPLDVLHRRDEFGDAFDIRRVIGLARYQRETHPSRLADRCEALGKTQRRREVASRDLAIGVRISSF